MIWGVVTPLDSSRKGSFEGAKKQICSPRRQTSIPSFCEKPAEVDVGESRRYVVPGDDSLSLRFLLWDAATSAGARRVAEYSWGIN